MHVCDRCGKSFDNSELNSDEKLVLDKSGKWMVQATYRCYTCAKQAIFGIAQ